MNHLTVRPAHLKELAENRMHGVSQVAAAIELTKDVDSQLVTTHGEISRASTDAAIRANAARRAAGIAIANASASLAEGLEIARQAYENIDIEAAKRL